MGLFNLRNNIKEEQKRLDLLENNINQKMNLLHQIAKTPSKNGVQKSQPSVSSKKPKTSKKTIHKKVVKHKKKHIKPKVIVKREIKKVVKPKVIVKRKIKREIVKPKPSQKLD